MKKPILFLSIIIIILVGLNILLIIKHKKINNNFDKHQNELSGNDTRIFEALKNNLCIQHFMESFALENIELGNIESKTTISFYSLMEQGEFLLVFRFKETNCDGCVKNTLTLLENISSNFPSDKIVILSGYQNTRQFYAFANQWKKGLRIFNVEDLPWPIEEQEQPYFFVLNPTAKSMQNVFIVIKEDNELIHNYLHCIKEKYWHPIPQHDCCSNTSHDHENCNHIH